MSFKGKLILTGLALLAMVLILALVQLRFQPNANFLPLACIAVAFIAGAFLYLTPDRS